jgi:uncharacterized protein YkwD
MKYVIVSLGILGLFMPLSASAISSAELADKVNQVRIDNKVGFLNWNPELARVAEARARYLLRTQTLDHNGWRSFYPKGFCGVGENLAALFPSSDSVVEGWMESLTHKANIMERRFSLTGLAVVKGKFKGQDTFLVVQTFGRKC